MMTTAAATASTTASTTATTTMSFALLLNIHVMHFRSAVLIALNWSKQSFKSDKHTSVCVYVSVCMCIQTI